MMLLRRYIVMAVLRGVATVLAVLVVVTSAIEFVGQLNDVGTGDYTLQTAITYVGLRVPRTISPGPSPTRSRSLRTAPNSAVSSSMPTSSSPRRSSSPG